METPEFPCSDKRLSDANHFAIEDLLDFPNDDAIVSSDAAAADESASALLDTSLGSSYPADAQFSGELCVPYDELAELEWLSNIVDESFCSEDLQKLHLIQGVGQTATPDPVGPIPTEMLVPAKARSKRSRAAPESWTSRLLAVKPAAPAEEARVKKPAAGHRKKEGSAEGAAEGRRCLHCATDKTPQWRTGPMGPKTLCNACGVRFKSGRLVPEYRPASSPTFVLAKHSNSHRKVLELRRQKEVQRAQMHQQQFMHHRHQNVVFDVASNGDDYLIHQHIGPDFRQLI